METASRILLPVFLVLFFVIAMAGRSFLHWKRTGVNPYKLGKTESAHDLIGAMFRTVSFLVIFSTAVYSFLPSVYGYLGRIEWLESVWVQATGFVLLLAALIWVSVGQGHMGESWRIGIDEENETELVHKGLFSLSRNPIFLGMRVLLFGLFLAAPNALTLLAFGVGDVLMQVQVRLEEQHMLRLHGERFEEYKKQVRRWV
ncbi:MAG: isoprenylcysteine carboxylmethyltransferase family protein [Acidobacteria bacterium]|nr:MAG: isoprenylcysteine carboxylmethyltransferase family protein [Acidobacteriota bacterium]REJ99343.1 MAG: isoprenylcysteine carboxylmethyltransferase family protein [Acidobacteriota bacterium]REK16486.1 MAG: isoprenylcysteine carboxylmethyltransferase family protein [Acidobacteriota bacterium]REK44168.1 MAG: isoprenylcysteine carboxylmethyltransferase family protein [Acidobacteriota bacterium]